VEHYGGGAGYWNVLRLYPERGVGVVAMANTTRAYDFTDRFDCLAAESGGERAVA